MGDKSQLVRLVDVFVLGPFMVWYAWRTDDVPAWARAAMAASGVATVVYNGRNYLAQRRAEGGSW